MIVQTVTAAGSGQRLDKYIHRVLPEAPTSFIYKMLRKKNITLRGKKADGRETVQAGDEVKFFLSDDTWQKFGGGPADSPGVTPGENRKEAVPADRDYAGAYRRISERYPGLRIVYEDRHVLIAEKPAGLLSQKAAPQDESLNEWFVGYLLESGQVQEKDLSFYTPSVANRLDRNTGGLVLCAKSLQGSRALSELLRVRTIHKYYQMVVCGRVEKAGVLEGYLRKDEETNVVQVIPVPVQRVSGSQRGSGLPRGTGDGGRRLLSSGERLSYARTMFRPLSWSRNGQLTLLEAELVTGRTHQLRVQLSHAGHPILGDPKYGNRKQNQLYRDAGVHEQLLYCVRVEFPRMAGALEALSGKTIQIGTPSVFTRVMER